jgi:phosphoribosylanthranilate isomerase
MRTRIKICGLTRESDVAAACAAGADAVGFVCYPKSPRYVAPERLRSLARELDPFTTPVLLFVNATHEAIADALRTVPAAVLQFHGDESEADCQRYGRPYLRSVHVAEGVDLLDCERRFSSASALLLDAPSAVFGGSGKAFDWTLVPRLRTKRVVLAGGIGIDNVQQAVEAVRPDAVDVSSGVEDAPGLKSAARMKSFVDAVRQADSKLSD